MKPVHKNPVIAVAQIRYFDTAKKNNIAKIEKYIGMASRARADIICFPESCIQKGDFLKLDHRLVQTICLACKKNNIWAIVTDDFEIKGTIYTMSILIDRKGRVRGDYRKINLYGDSDAVTPGKKTFVYKTDFAKIGIAICWDMAFPELFMKMKKKGAQIVFIPSHWSYEYRAYNEKHKIRELTLIKSLISSRAFENLIFIAYANPLTNDSDLVSYSAIVSPHHILKDIQDKEGLIVQRINLREIRKFSKIYPNKK